MRFTKIYTNKFVPDCGKRRRQSTNSGMMKGEVVAMVLSISILSLVVCNDFLSTSSSFAAIFVTGLTIPASKVTKRTINSPQGIEIGCQRHRTHWDSRYFYPSDETQPLPLPLSRQSGRCLASTCLFGSKDEGTSTMVLPRAPTINKEESLLIPVASDDVVKNVENEVLMNPMENFPRKQDIENLEIDADDEYNRGLVTIGFITFLFATNSPVLHWAFTSGSNPPPVLLVNAAVSVVALVGLMLGGDTLEGNGSLPNTTNQVSGSSGNDNDGWVGGLELGIWKFLGTTSNLYGLALTTASHGALLIQLTTLIVPTTRALVYKESISTKLKISIALALSGVLCFANDPTGTPSLLGDALCVVAAVCYSAYDLRLYEYGKIVDAVKPLITTKIATQALFSIGLLFVAPSSLLSGESARTSAALESYDYMQDLAASSEWLPVVVAIIWSGVAVNAVAPFLQVCGQQIVGPTKCQTIYASQPLWAAILSFVFLKERLGISGAVGGTAFLVALVLAATAENSSTTITATDTDIEMVTEMPETALPASMKGME